ncbi:MAG: hypothetical protein E6G41_02645 [Actinobacteria bacterium]|nr:MAG: hypothetical protein E6G41_02645 [Actinomycetota bacterium]
MRQPGGAHGDVGRPRRRGARGLRRRPLGAPSPARDHRDRGGRRDVHRDQRRRGPAQRREPDHRVDVVGFAGDGIVIATPLGSSAYTLAAGGPVLAPRADAIALTPLAPHGGTAPPLVVARGSETVLTVEPGYYGARVEIDGHVADLPAKTLTLGWRRDYALLVSFEGAEPFFAGLRRRGILADSPRVRARAAR